MILFWVTWKLLIICNSSVYNAICLSLLKKKENCCHCHTFFLVFVESCLISFFFFWESEKENRGGRQWCDVSHDPPMLILTDTLADIQGGSLFPSHITAANKGTTNKRSLHVTKRVTPRWPPSVLQRRHRRALANLHTYSSFTGISLHYY